MGLIDLLYKLLMVASIPALVFIFVIIVGYGEAEHAILTGSWKKEDQDLEARAKSLELRE